MSHIPAPWPAGTDPALSIWRLDAVIRRSLSTQGVAWETSPDAPDTFEALTARCTTKHLIVWDGASGSCIWSPEANYRYRAWHDRAHLALALDFTPVGERAVAVAHLAEVRRRGAGELAARLLWAESQGQNEYLARWGDFPRDQRGFSLAYCYDAERALSQRW